MALSEDFTNPYAQKCLNDNNPYIKNRYSDQYGENSIPGNEHLTVNSLTENNNEFKHHDNEYGERPDPYMFTYDEEEPREEGQAERTTSRRKQSKPARVHDHVEPPETVQVENIVDQAPAEVKPEYDEPEYTFPTAYHKLGQELGFEEDARDLSSKLNPEDGVPVSRNENGEPRNKIFHQDAYCELCDREFCNKYFLKTHKANKHGVYENIHLFGSPNGQYEQSQEKEDDQAYESQGYGQSLEREEVSSPVNMTLPHDLSKQSPPLSHNSPGKSPNTDTAEGQEDKTSVPQRSLEDYCELCQKHFCNKYYLRKHRMDVHGIHTDPFSVKRRMSNLDHMGNMTSSPVLLPQSGHPMPNAMNNIMLFNPFAPMMGLPPNPMMPPHLPPTMGPSPLMFPGMEIGERSKKESKGINTDAYCEICRKEFCDKYYLKVHKANVHNIQVEGSNRRSPHNSSTQTMVEKQAVKEEDEPMDFSRESPQKSSPRDEIRPQERLETRMEARVEQKPEPRPRTCEVCHKEFADKYALRMHRANIHGLTHHPHQTSLPEEQKEPLFSPFIPTSRIPYMDIPNSMSMPTSMAMPFPPPIPSMSGSGSESPLGTMFGSMVAAKLADRVTCDICNKDVCNKYFLKTHKVKMHGIDPNTIKDIFPREKEAVPKKIKAPTAAVPASAIKEAQDTAAKELFKLNTDSGPNRSEELLKLGIDPEAYCDICKKEFCSKYFLRTHKLKMHGIPTDKPGNRKEDREISRKEIMERELMAMRDFNSFYPPPMTIYPGLLEPNRGQPLQMPPMPQLPRPNFYPPTSLGTSPQEDDTRSQDSGKSSDSKSKNREPANMVRVKCELCNKELCNKYFLRTHKLNKHGIVDECLSEGQQRKFMERNMLSENPFALLNKENPLSFLKRDDSNCERLLDEKESRFYKEYNEICHICQRRFTSLDWLKTHLYVEHDIRESVPCEMIVDNGGKKEIRFPCQACGVLFTDKIGLQIHMVQEHHVEINVTPEAEDKPEDKHEETVKRRKVYSCSQCCYKSRRFTNIQLHEIRKHGLKLKPKFRCNKCNKLFRLRQALESHIKQCDGTFDFIKRFKCVYCNERFQTRFENRKHVMIQHKTSRKHQCKDCSFSSNEPKKLRFHIRMRHQSRSLLKNHLTPEQHGRPALVPVANGLDEEEKTPVCYAKPCDLKSQSFIMQPFTITDENDYNRFVKAVVYLPVFEKINESRSYSFQLTPAE